MTSGPIDLRSDTVTKPTPEMRRAMAEAEVGDDVIGSDPTVDRLEARAAERVGKEAALFTPSGSMANNIAIKAHTQPGDEVLLDEEAHSLLYEVAGPAQLSFVQTRMFASDRGVPRIETIERGIHTRSLHSPGTTLLLLENTHNRAGGAVIPIEVHRAVRALCLDRGLKIHLDGARLFNAVVASGVPAHVYAAEADSVSFCLSKGLGCPVGSLLCGDRDFIDRSRRIRKLFGGGMRQAGVLAAPGLIALETGIERLADDHRNARRLAEGLVGLPGIHVDLDAVPTNMVYFDTDGPAKDLADRLEAEGVRCLPLGERRIRMVTHRDVTAEEIETAIAAVRRLGGGYSA